MTKEWIEAGIILALVISIANTGLILVFLSTPNTVKIVYMAPPKIKPVDYQLGPWIPYLVCQANPSLPYCKMFPHYNYQPVTAIIGVCLLLDNNTKMCIHTIPLPIQDANNQTKGKPLCTDQCGNGVVGDDIVPADCVNWYKNHPPLKCENV